MAFIIFILFSISAFSDCCMELTESHDHVSSKIDPDHHSDKSSSEKEDCHCFNICSHQVYFQVFQAEIIQPNHVSYFGFPAVHIGEESAFTPNIFIPPIVYV